MYEAKILADSVSPEGVRLTTCIATYPHMVHAHVLTHRMLSKSTASSRAIPVEKMIAAVRTAPYAPAEFCANQRGMVAGGALDDAANIYAREEWLEACENACQSAANMAQAGVHKQWVNRLLEPFAMTKCVITGTDWSNFYALRTHADAQPEIRQIASMLLATMADSKPRELARGEWHLPYVTDEERASGDRDLVGISAGRSARISYLTHDGKHDIAADLALCNRLIPDGHMGPMEHQATPFALDEWMAIEEAQMCFRAFAPKSWNAERIEAKCCAMEYSGNLRGWTSFRKLIPGESVFNPNAA